MKLWNTVETTQQWKFGKIAWKVWTSLALVWLLSWTANANWIDAQDEERCEIIRPISRYNIWTWETKTKRQMISCEWNQAFTSTYWWYWESKTVKVDKTWKPQNCKCITKTEIIEWTFSTKKAKTVTILLNDWLGENNNSNKTK